LFDGSTIDHLLASCRRILEGLLDEPETKVASLAITPELVAQAEASRRDDDQTIAIAGTFTAEPLTESLQHWIRELNLGARIEFAPFNQVFQQLLDPTSVLMSNARGLNVLLVRFEDWFQPDEGSGKMNDSDCKRVADEFVAALKTAARNTTSPFLVSLCPASTPAQADVARATLLRDMEERVTGALSAEPGVFVVNHREFQDLYPVANYYDASGDELGRVPYTAVFFTALSTIIARKFHALRRAPHKVIVLDCDHTLWSGVCGEDGASGIQLDPPRIGLQEFMRAQRDAGKLLAICSKNNEEDVREVFETRSEMPLRPEHIVTWRTNWISKSENIKSIAKELKIGLDSFIFVDDNPVECAEVEANCPEVLVLQLPEDCERIPKFLKHCWAFDQLRITTEDRGRVESYGRNRDREALRAQSMTLADFIAGLNLQIQIGPMSPDQLSRMSQLTQRTNQFNCTTIRRTEAEIQAAATSAAVLAVNVRDRFGDYGIVGEMIFSRREQALDVDTFLLSCRVLGRGVEHAMLAHLGKIALDEKRRWVDIHFNPSPRNKPASDFLQSFGQEFRQPLNGGYVYKFPAEFAAEVTFNPPSTEPVQLSAPEAGPAASDSGVKPRGSELFRRCRTIALEYDDAEKIHQAIEKKATIRSVGHRDYKSPTTELERQLCRIWESLLRLERVGVDDNFFELGGHSLLAVRLFAEIEKLSGRKLPLVTIFQAPTVSLLAKALEQSETIRSHSPLVPIQPRGDRPPLFLIHGAGGDVLWGYANLAKHMHPDQPIYGIKSRGQIGLDEFDSIEEMARYYLEEVRAFQPNGPYLFGGYCLGGNIAYEMARQLEASGERVGPVLLIDAFPSNAGYERVTWWRPLWSFRFTRNLWYWLADFRQQTAKEQRRFIGRKARTWARKLTRRFTRGRAAPDDVDLEEVIDLDYFPEHELKFWEIHLRALVNHVERAFPGPVTLIRTRGQPLCCSFESDFCWSRLAARVVVKRIPGSHENIFIEPNVRFLAKEVEDCLAAARGSASRPVGGTINS
jgi:FkbH-like protein